MLERQGSLGIDDPRRVATPRIRARGRPERASPCRCAGRAPSSAWRRSLGRRAVREVSSARVVTAPITTSATTAAITITVRPAAMPPPSAAPNTMVSRVGNTRVMVPLSAIRCTRLLSACSPTRSGRTRSSRRRRTGSPRSGPRGLESPRAGGSRSADARGSRGVRVSIAREARVVLEDGCLLGEGCRIEAAGGRSASGRTRGSVPGRCSSRLRDRDRRRLRVGEWARSPTTSPRTRTPSARPACSRCAQPQVRVGDGAPSAPTRPSAGATVAPGEVVGSYETGGARSES